jgi:hypothetical protein
LVERGRPVAWMDFFILRAFSIIIRGKWYGGYKVCMGEREDVREREVGWLAGC